MTANPRWPIDKFTVDLNKTIQPLTQILGSGETISNPSGITRPVDIGIDITGGVFFSTRTVAAATDIPAIIVGILTGGYYVNGDLGGAKYKRTSGTTYGGFQSADGAWWQLSEDEISARMCGARGLGNDDTASLQTWLNALAEQNVPGHLPSSTSGYSTTADLVCSQTGCVNLRGDTFEARSYIVMTIDGLNGIHFNASGTGNRIVMRDMGFISIANSFVPTSGAAILADGVSTTYQNSLFDNVRIQSCYDGISGSALTGYTINNCGIACQSNCLKITDPGDSFIIGNTFTGLKTTAVGLAFTGLVAGTRIQGNKFNGSTNMNYAISFAIGVSDGDILVQDNSIEGTNGGIIIDSTGGATFGNIMIQGNEFNCLAAASQRAVHIVPSTAHWLHGLSIVDNVGAFGTGILVNSADLVSINGNIMADSTGLIVLGANVITGTVYGNCVTAANAIQVLSTTLAIYDNPGFNPVGTSAAATMGASPTTITAGPSPETHYVNQSATNTATITKGTHQIAALVNASTFYQVELGPNESYVTTWLTTAPTYVRDIH